MPHVLALGFALGLFVLLVVWMILVAPPAPPDDPTAGAVA